MKNLKIILCIGISGSGKSSWSLDFVRRNEKYIRVSRDSFRSMFKYKEYHDVKTERMITNLVNVTILEALNNKLNVVVDETNLNVKHLNEFIEKYKTRADISFRIFDISIKKAIERDSTREHPVGEVVLKKQFKNYLQLYDSNFDFSTRRKIDKIVSDVDWNPNPSLPNAILFDIDGTIAHMQGKRGTFDWKKVDRDVVDERMKLTMSMFHDNGFKIIVVTGRDGISYDLTKEWLDFNEFKYDYLFTKPKNDFRKDSVTKKEIYENHIKDKFNIFCSFDDRQQSVENWRKLGIKTYQVMDGNF